MFVYCFTIYSCNPYFSKWFDKRHSNYAPTIYNGEIHVTYELYDFFVIQVFDVYLCFEAVNHINLFQITVYTKPKHCEYI